MQASHVAPLRTYIYIMIPKDSQLTMPTTILLNFIIIRLKINTEIPPAQPPVPVPATKQNN